MKRLEEEVTWFCDKQDYLNRDKDWGNSRTASSVPSRNSAEAILQTLCSKLITDPVCFQNQALPSLTMKEEVRQTFHSIVLLPLFHNSIFFFLFPKSIFFDFKTPSS